MRTSTLWFKHIIGLATLTVLTTVVLSPLASAATKYTCTGDCRFVRVEDIGNPAYAHFHLFHDGIVTHFNVRESASQREYPANSGRSQRLYVKPNKQVSVQSCRRSVASFGSSTCTGWTAFRLVEVKAPPGPTAPGTTAATCKPGFVWRVARPSDLVCVTPESRARVAQENQTAASRRQPGGGAFGPNTCRQGYVWREAFSGDVVCVTPEVRTLVREENRVAASRRVGN